MFYFAFIYPATFPHLPSPITNQIENRQSVLLYCKLIINISGKTQLAMTIINKKIIKKRVANNEWYASLSVDGKQKRIKQIRLQQQKSTNTLTIEQRENKTEYQRQRRRQQQQHNKDTKNLIIDPIQLYQLKRKRKTDYKRQRRLRKADERHKVELKKHQEQLQKRLDTVPLNLFIIKSNAHSNDELTKLALEWCQSELMDIYKSSIVPIVPSTNSARMNHQSPQAMRFFFLITVKKESTLNQKDLNSGQIQKGDTSTGLWQF